jgi:glycine reductase
MTLTVQTLRVSKVSMARASGFAEGHLRIDPEALGNRLRNLEPRIEDVRLHLAKPGDATRVLCCKDVVQPRFKLDAKAPGSGHLGVLDGVAVVTCGPIVGFQEGIIDMSGPGAGYTPFSRLHLVVLELQVEPGTRPRDHEAIVRAAGLEAAGYLGGLCVDTVPEETREILWNEVAVDEHLPRIAYVCMVLTQGLLHDTYLLGENASGILPRVLDPRVVLDNGVVSGNCVSACDKNTTYHHQNNPIIRLLLDGHGERWNFVGLVMTDVPTRLAEKQRSAELAISLTRELGARGAVVSKEGFGNPDADLMMLLRGLELGGVQAVALSDEFAGADGGSQSLADSTPQANAIISTGNANERVRLPPMATVIGPLADAQRLAGGYAGSLGSDGSMEVELQAIMGATNQLGFSSLSCREV